jgi:hypothetical protein
MESTTRRGYGWAHQRRRAAFARLVAAGLAICWRCGQPIEPGEPWDLGHDDIDRRRYRGPEHRRCNRTGRARRDPAPSVNLEDYPEDDPSRHIYWGPPDFQSGRPRRWSRPWSDWRGELFLDRARE